jgi:hypothetical protein
MQSDKEGDHRAVGCMPDVAVDKEWTVVDRIQKKQSKKKGKCDATISMISCSKSLLAL